MKYIALIFSLLILSYTGKAQQYLPEYKIIYQDTINIRGIVYFSDGRPAPRVEITSKNNEYKYYGYHLATVTSKDGTFQLNGARFNDTIKVETSQHTLKIANSGARYLTITLPPDKVPNSFKPDTEIVTAKRLHRKKSTSSFKVEVASILDYGCVIKNTGEPPGGRDKYISYIRKKMTYPDKAVENNMEGVVEIGFLVQTDGQLTDFKILKGIGYGCDEQVIDALKKGPRWKPGILCGPQEEYNSITINFKLTDK